MSLDNRRAIVLFSGGQDSTVCLYWAMKRYDQVETVGFNYGQQHVVELDCRRQIRKQLQKCFPLVANRLGKDHLVDASVLSEITESALTAGGAIDEGPSGLSTAFVPGRNIIFLTLAAVIAHRRKVKHLVGGMCETDFSGYPDCRDDSVKAIQVALNLAIGANFVIETPLMWIGKAETWSLAKELGGDALLELILEETHTCYLGDRSVRHTWGYGCGNCPACVLRKRGYERFVVS
mgnify:CR=1 FL=1